MPYRNPSHFDQVMGPQAHKGMPYGDPSSFDQVIGLKMERRNSSPFDQVIGF